MGAINRFTLYTAGIGLVILGTLCTAFWLYSQAPSIFPYMAAAAFLAGALLEIGKKGLMIAGVGIMRKGRVVVSSVILLVCVVLSSISMYTTYQFLIVGATGGTQAQKTIQSATGSISRSIDGIDAQIASIGSSIKSNIETAQGLRSFDRWTQADQVLQRNEPLEEMRILLTQERTALLSQFSEAEAGAVEVSGVQAGVFAAVAVLIDVVGTLCILLASFKPLPTPTPQRERATQFKGLKPVEAMAPMMEPALSPAPTAEPEQKAEQRVEPAFSQIVPRAVETEPKGQGKDKVENSSSTKQTTLNLKAEPEPRKKAVPQVVAKSEGPSKAAIGKRSEEELVKKALEAIRAGTEPKKAAIRSVLRVADSRALKVLRILENQGYIARTGRGWTTQI